MLIIAPLVGSASAAHGAMVTGQASDRMVVLPDFSDDGFASGARNIRISLPKDYFRSDARYPVIYFSDGEAVFGPEVATDKIYDKLVQEKAIPPAILIAIDNARGRTKDLTPTLGVWTDAGGNLGGYGKFITTVLKPYIDSHFRTKPEAASTGIAGWSLGGLAAFTLAYDHPDVFGMAGCMSSSFWWDHDLTMTRLKTDGAAKKPIRIWLDAGGGEWADVWTNAQKVSALLLAKGWTTGDDLAAYFDYHNGHDVRGWRERMRPMLLFLLGKEPLKLRGARIVAARDPGARTLTLNVGENAPIRAESLYGRDLRLTSTNPQITAEDPRIIVFDGEVAPLVHALAAGKTRLVWTNGGRRALLNVVVRPIPDPVLKCPRAAVPKSVDGDLSDWPRLPYEIPGDPGTKPTQFGVAYDDNNLYIAIHVPDRSVIAAEKETPWRQDGVEIRLDGRPFRISREYLGDLENDPKGSLMIGMSPGAAGQRVGFYPSDSWDRVIPAGTKAVCLQATKAGTDGYSAEVSIPIAYLNERQSDHWSDFRLNICIDSINTPGGAVTQYWWNPDWRSPENRFDSGIFARQ